MQITALAAADKIHELRSKLAIYQSLADTIRINYLPVEAAAAELRITRDDGSVCQPAHFVAVLEEFEDRCAELQEELTRWEAMTFEPPSAEVHQFVTGEARRASPERRVHGGRRLQPASTSKS